MSYPAVESIFCRLRQKIILEVNIDRIPFWQLKLLKNHFAIYAKFKNNHTQRRPSDVTRWLGGGHNFTCKIIALIQHALGASIIEITK